MADFTRTNQIAARHHLAVIEDGTQSFGATQNGQHSCGVTLIAITSFFWANPLGCYGDGGALFTNNDVFANRIRNILPANHRKFAGLHCSKTDSRFDTIQAAVLLAKLPHFESELAERKRLGERYTALLTPLLPAPGSLPIVMPGNTHVYAQYVIRVPRREIVARSLYNQGISATSYDPWKQEESPAYSSYRFNLSDYPEADQASREVLSLPLHPFLTAADQDRVINALKHAMHIR